VLVDTFLVRTVIVPAVTTLLGDRTWWPSNARAGTRGLSGVIQAPEAPGGAGAGFPPSPQPAAPVG
jgi:RND superfamily putative drug exporter